MSDQMTIFELIRSLPCCACGKRPTNATHIKPKELGGPDEYFNLIPICNKHLEEKEKVGMRNFIERNLYVQRYIAHKGWIIEKTLFHKDLNES